MPDFTPPQAGPVGASSHSNDQESVSGSRPSATSGLFGGRGTAFVVLALSLAITIPWSIRFQALPGFAGAAGGTGAMFLAAGAVIISLLLFALVWILTSTRLRAEALALEMTHDLRESEARFRNAFDAAAIGMAIVSLDGKWIQVNSQLCRMLGYSEPDLKKLTFQDVTHPDDLKADLDYVGQVLRGEIPSYQMEKRYFHKDDNRRFVLVNEATGRFHQRPAGDFLGKLDSDFYPAERAKQAWAEDDAVVESGTPLEEEQSFQTIPGEVRWVVKHKRAGSYRRTVGAGCSPPCSTSPGASLPKSR